MKIHPQLLKTVHLLEDLRRQQRAKTVTLKFGWQGLESVNVDGLISAPGKMVEVGKILDNGDANKLV